MMNMPLQSFGNYMQKNPQMMQGPLNSGMPQPGAVQPNSVAPDQSPMNATPDQMALQPGLKAPPPGTPLKKQGAY